MIKTILKVLLIQFLICFPKCSRSHPLYIKKSNKVSNSKIPSWCIGVGESFPWINWKEGQALLRVCFNCPLYCACTWMWKASLASSCAATSTKFSSILLWIVVGERKLRDLQSCWSSFPSGENGTTTDFLANWAAFRFLHSAGPWICRYEHNSGVLN